MSDKVRQAVVVVHGMGEQRPLETLQAFIAAALPRDHDEEPDFHSRPDQVTPSFEARRYLAPRSVVGGKERSAQTEFFEYHWAHHMTGNRLDDMWPTFRRMLLTWPWMVPDGLKVVWALFWAAALWVGWALWRGPWSSLDIGSVDAVVTAVVGGGAVGFVLTYVVSRLAPSWITTSFVDVVRYLDTSPRSFEVRRSIRAGMVDLLKGLHDARRYDRIIVVAHSLGAYIAYDGITYLWAQMNTGEPADSIMPTIAGVEPLEEAASRVHDDSGASVEDYQKAQRHLWLGLRAQGNPWLITDFVSLGTPMSFAHRLYTKNRTAFERLKDRRELPTCPPEDDRAGGYEPKTRYTFTYHRRQMLYHAAPFAVVRWTNLYFPTPLWFFGDWFGGPLAPLFGHGVRDVKVTGNRPVRWVPAYAHALYFKLTALEAHDVRTLLRAALDLPATSWLAGLAAARARSVREVPEPPTDERPLAGTADG